MGPRTRILDAAMLVFRRQGFRRSSIEQAAEAAGLTRQALYHHFKSKEALFRAVIERLHEDALAAEIAAAAAAEKEGGSLADILVASVTAKLGQLAASLEARPMSRNCSPNICCRRATLPEIHSSLCGAACRDHRARLPQAGPRSQRRHDAARSCALCRDGGQRHQIRLPRDAAGRCFPQRSGNHAAHAGRRRRAPGAKPRAATPKPAKKAVPRSTSRKSGDRR